jgi:hypothetical protein
MRIEKRLRALEGRLLSEPVTLHFAKGSSQKLYGPRTSC